MTIRALFGLVALAFGMVMALLWLLPNASPLESAWTVLASIGLWHAAIVFARCWRIERWRAKRKANGLLKIISIGHVHLRGIGVLIQVLCLVAGATSLITPEARTASVSAYQAVVLVALLGIGMLAALGAYLAEQNLRDQLRYLRRQTRRRGSEL